MGSYAFLTLQILTTPGTSAHLPESRCTGVSKTLSFYMTRILVLAKLVEGHSGARVLFGCLAFAFWYALDRMKRFGKLGDGRLRFLLHVEPAGRLEVPNSLSFWICMWGC